MSLRKPVSAAPDANHDVDAIHSLLTEDHRFIDSMGTVFKGRDVMRMGWSHYFRMVPDYAIHVELCLENGPQVVLLGSAGGTYTPDSVLREEGRWRTQAAWSAIVEADQIALWQIFADNEPIRRRMAELAPRKV